MRATRVFAGAVVLLLTACGFSFERRSEVLDRRVLAIQAEPPEIVVEPGAAPPVVKVRALVVDPDEPAAETEYEWRLCVDAGKDGGFVGETGRCDEATAETLLDKGAKALPELGLDVPVSQELLGIVSAIGAGGRGLSLWPIVQLRFQSAQGPQYAQKRLVLSPPIPAGRRANRNPKLVGLLLDGEPWEPGAPRALGYGRCGTKDEALDPSRPGEFVSSCAHTITPVFDEADAEDYVVQTFELETRNVRERLRFDWHTDTGSFSRQRTSMPQPFEPAERDPLSTKWREPPVKPSAPVTVWVVVRDGRGGESWETRQLGFE